MDIRDQIEKIMNSYDPERDLYPHGVQVNVTDIRLLDIIETLEARLTSVEIATGLRLPPPLPLHVSEPTRLTFADEIDYGGGGDGQELESIF